MSQHAVYVYHPDETLYRFNDTHPFDQERLLLTGDLLRKAGALDDSQIVTPTKAGERDLLLVHTPEYVEAVKRLSEPHPSEEAVRDAERFGLNTDDTPYFAGMHDVTLQIVGGSIEAAEAVMSGMTDHALHLGGGLHHAMPNKGAGFCVYNDASVAIAYIRARYGVKVLYVDTDVHHGDGVQWSFYHDPNVCTLSFHETGKYLFPGTGAANERGEGEGYGMCVNVPVEPYTEDESWMEGFDEALDRVVRFFKPDVIVSQHGCDAHALDPLAHVHCSTRIYVDMPRTIHRLAHRYCGGRWIALGGGGYDIWRVVPRAWSFVWLAMTEHPLLDRIEREPDLPLPADWLAAWADKSPVELPTTWLDPTDLWTPMPRRREIVESNRRAREIALMYVPK
ncbi:acetoin utilization protein AcuC [Paenibacillus flagellatus]|uniref:Acetoin utilization protein AcuC n=1 Tax=Paenibacillus flagellatus TaxID=2211139 RepID=A0A2V5KIS2_9BACL|nr:acetoin utilization protein AcuC [Paenibacillus flagellatus]PYI54420.1 acetoin utilization protein AcuC [Paenibacillus flagellatus]